MKSFKSINKRQQLLIRYVLLNNKDYETSYIFEPLYKNLRLNINNVKVIACKSSLSTE